jgi:hypothetical protein
LQVFFPKVTTGFEPIGYRGGLLSSLLQVNVYVTHNLLNVLVQIANKISTDVDWAPLCNKVFFHSANHLLPGYKVSLPGYRPVRTCIEYGFVKKVFYFTVKNSVFYSETATTKQHQIPTRCSFSVNFPKCAFLPVCLTRETTTPILEHLSQPLAGSLPAQPPTMSPSQPPPCPTRTTVSYKRGRSTQESSDRVAKHVKDNHHLSPPTITSNRYTSLANEDSEATPTPASPTNVPKPPPIYIQNATTIPPPPHAATRPNCPSIICHHSPSQQSGTGATCDRRFIQIHYSCPHRQTR